MKFIRFCMVGITINCWWSCQAGLTGRSFFSPRSQSCDTVLDLVGWQEYINRCTTDCCYTAFATTVEYSQTFHPEKTAQYFFGTDKLLFSGSAVPLRGQNDILADYFGLPPDFASIVVFGPQANIGFVDLAWFCGLDRWVEKSYFRAHAPLVYVDFNPGMCEAIQQPGTQGYVAGYMGPQALERRSLYGSVSQALQGTMSAIGDIQPLKEGLVTGSHRKVALSEIELVLGYNPVLAPQHHFGFNLRVACPTGTRSKGHYFFEPVVGNGAHWQLGIGFTGHAIFYENVDTCKRFGVYADANICHLFASRQRRSFDLDRAGVFSRYALLEKMVTPAPVGLSLGSLFTPADNQYDRVLLQAINVTTLPADIAVAVQADFTIKCAYWYKNMSVDIGYNAWARTAETISNREQFPAYTYALKGDAQVYGFDLVNNGFIPLNATENSSTIQNGQGTLNADLENRNVDNAQPAFYNGNPLYTSSTGLDTIRGSLQAILLHNCDINDISGLSPAAVTHRFFVHLSYDFTPARTFVIPYAGLGASVEIDGTDAKTRSSFSKWAVWIKGGFAC